MWAERPTEFNHSLVWPSSSLKILVEDEVDEFLVWLRFLNFHTTIWLQWKQDRQRHSNHSHLMFHLYQASREEKRDTLLLIFGFWVAAMKSIRDSQISHLFVGSILSWIGTDGQCLAALHTHISALKPDQLTQPRHTNVSCVSSNVRAFLLREKRQHHQNSKCD